MFFMKSFDSRIKDIFTRGTISKGHFYQGHLSQRTFFKGPNLKDIFSEDQNWGTFCQGHFLKDICDMIHLVRIPRPDCRS
jgi:hypothetical protein